MPPLHCSTRPPQWCSWQARDSGPSGQQRTRAPPRDAARQPPWAASASNSPGQLNKSRPRCPTAWHGAASRFHRILYTLSNFTFANQLQTVVHYKRRGPHPPAEALAAAEREQAVYHGHAAGAHGAVQQAEPIGARRRRIDGAHHIRRAAVRPRRRRRRLRQQECRQRRSPLACIANDGKLESGPVK